MSADNAIYIRPLKSGWYAVKEISSFDPTILTDEEIDAEFGTGAAKFPLLDEAWAEEERLNRVAEEQQTPIEYGTVILHRKKRKKVNFADISPGTFLYLGEHDEIAAFVKSSLPCVDTLWDAKDQFWITDLT